MMHLTRTFCSGNRVQWPFMLTVASLLTLSVNSSEICGTVTTSEGNTISLRENETLSKEDFEKLHIKKLRNAIFNPDSDRECRIMVCGFTSFELPFQDGKLIGSSSDYSDCRTIRSKGTKAPPEIYNDVYNLSSINCACKKNIARCSYSCEEKRLHVNPAWQENECALLYQEDECNHCYYTPIALKTTDPYRTDVSHHINSIFVKDDCVVRQDIPAFRHFYRFQNATLPLNYTKDQGSNNVMSAYHSEEEKFFCECGLPPVTTPPPSTSTEVPQKTSSEGDTDFKAIAIVLGATNMLCLIVLGLVGVIICSSRDYENGSKLPTYLQWIPEKMYKRKSNDSVNTSTTTTSLGYGPFDYNSIFETSFSEAYDTSSELFQIGQKLNQGNHGEIYEAQLQVAIKVIKKSDDEESFRALQQEAKILSRIGTHRNVVRLLGVYSDNYNELSLLIEYCQNGSLKSYLQDVVEPHVKSIVRRKVSEDSVGNGDDYVTQEVLHTVSESEKSYDLEGLDPGLLRQMYSWPEQIAIGMEYISSKMRVIHGDLAARNILLNYKLIPKISDFGLSTKTYLTVNDKQMEGPTELPVRWLAPEVLCKHQDCSVESDVWSFGIVVWEIFTLGEYLPYNDKHGLQQIINAVLRSEKPGLPISCVPHKLYSKLLECWNEDPEKRPTFSALREYFSEMKIGVNDASANSDYEPAEVSIV